MIIEFTGKRHIVRQVGGYCWSRENGFQQDVTDRALVAELILHPPSDFAVAPMDPLAQAVGVENAALMAIEGVISPDDLSTLSAAQMKELAQKTNIPVKTLRGWVKGDD